MAGMRSGNRSAAKGNRSKGQRSASLGQRSRGARSNTAGNITGGGGAGGPKKKSTSRGMRKSTWDNLSGAQKMQEYGTTSYTKYKAGLARSRKSAGRAIEQRGTD
jgi:hypothetical protein